MAKMLTENHPIFKKVDKLLEYMDELGLTIHASSLRGIQITEKDSDLDIRYADKEDGREVYDFPSGYEHKLLIDE